MWCGRSDGEPFAKEREPGVGLFPGSTRKNQEEFHPATNKQKISKYFTKLFISCLGMIFNNT